MHHFCRNILINMLGKYLYRYFDIWQRYISINTFGKISSKLFFVVAKHRRTIVNKITNYWDLKAMEDIIYFLLARLENGVGNLRSQNLCKIYTGHFQSQPEPNTHQPKIIIWQKFLWQKSWSSYNISVECLQKKHTWAKKVQFVTFLFKSLRDDREKYLWL